jgi:nucleotide-binding universal stress UspA family protein
MMHRFRKLLVPIHGDASRQPVVARASWLAKQTGASIKLIAFVEDFPWYARLVLPNAAELQNVLVREMSEALARLAKDVRSKGIECSTEVLNGRLHLETVREVLRGGHDLLMKEADPKGSIVFSSTDLHLLRACPCPVWLFKPEHAGGNFAQVLVAVDPAPPPDTADLLHVKDEVAPKDAALDVKLLEIAGSLAEHERAELHVVHAWSAPGESVLRSEVMLATEEVERYVEDARTEARKALEKLVGAVPAGAGRRFVHSLKGDPEDVIVDFAKARRVDLIVMGTIARTGMSGFLIGNTAETILQRVDCSVLAIKPDGFVTPIKLAD